MATFQISEAEFVRGTQAMTWKRRTWIMYFVAYLLFMLSLTFKGYSALIAIGGPLISVVVIVALVSMLSRYRMKRVFRETASLQEPFKVTIDDQQLSYSWSRGSYALPWANVRRWKETKDFFILFESSFYGRMLPKRALSGDEVAIIRRHVASKPER